MSMETLSGCPLCGASAFSAFMQAKDFTVSGTVFSIVKCNSCELLFTNPRPDKNEIGKFYDSPDYISHSNSKKGLMNQVYQRIRKISIDSKLGLIERFCTKKDLKLLDIGCGTGEFLNACQNKGWNLRGIEPSEQAKAQAIGNYKLQVGGEEDLNRFDPGSFDVITMWHVLEHVHDLKKRIELLQSLLYDNGYAIVAVPNPNSADAAEYKEFWAAYDVPRHLYHFTPKVIIEAFQKQNMFHVKSFPMPFDSYYVAMLSEKYKKSSLGIVKAFFAGWRSNLKAGKNAEKYSSTIYVFKKGR